MGSREVIGITPATSIVDAVDGSSTRHESAKDVGAV
jgi:hypothetical protein